MDAEQALADLMEISSQVESAVVLDGEGAVAASSIATQEGADHLAAAVREALVAAEAARPEAALAQLEASTRAGSLFVVRDGERTIAATTASAPTAGLVLYDLRSCLRALGEDEQG